MELKFRAWDRDNNLMFYSEDNQSDDFTFIGEKDGLQFYHIDENRYLKDTNSVLMQYTGLTDKNGVEIFEGDIITTDIDSIKGTLIYRYGCFQVKYGHEKYKSLINISYPEVIGNIYQHKHLLKENENENKWVY